MILPKVQSKDIIVQDLSDELLVYNLSTHQAFCLNETSAKVFVACDGQTSFDDLKRQCQFTDDLIHLALDEFKTKGLIKDYQSEHFGNLSRREVIRRVGLATMIALPVVAGLSAPLAAQAQSTNVCAANNCVDGNVACNPGAGCGALGGGTLICCFAGNSCFCTTAAVCTGNGGQICA